jgi:hypothetical protein
LEDRLMRYGMLTSSVLALGSVLPALAWAESPTGPAATPVAAPAAGEICVSDYRQLAAKLAQSYAEEPVSAGLGQDGNLVSVFASATTGTWTMVMTRPEGTSCVVAVGEAWQMKTPTSFQPPA